MSVCKVSAGAGTKSMIVTPPQSPGLPGSHSVPGPAPPPSSPCPSPSFSPFCAGMTLHRTSSSSSSFPMRNLDLRRHSWQPGPLGLMAGYAPQYQQRSVSLEGFNTEEMEHILLGALEGPIRGGRDPRRAPITSYSQASLLSLSEEDGGCQTPLFIPLESCQLQGISTLCASPRLLQTPSLHPHPQTHSHTHTEKPHQQHGQPHHHSNSSNSQRRLQGDFNLDSSPGSVFGVSTLSVDAELGEQWEETRTEGKRGVPPGEERRTEGTRGVPPEEERGEKAGSSLGRTFSFLRKMAGPRKSELPRPAGSSTSAGQTHQKIVSAHLVWC
ncbi:hypothetical protein DPEC_G00352420 [Dallia pectoralis]|uniref:Uncharacterized protein n=1 Tax=Dallia pectoralis TaxID=75939 RepID=A0ACC2F265_DALPE|nr:hypothetical protein DPEC_G00352420 [Dallia pectoralis]